MAGHTAVDTVPSGVRLDVARREARVNFRAIKAMSTSVDPPRAAVTGLLREGCGVIPEIKQVAHPVSSIRTSPTTLRLAGHTSLPATLSPTATRGR